MLLPPNLPKADQQAVLDWGIVGDTNPLQVRLNGAGLAVPVAIQAAEAATVAADDKVLVLRVGNGGYLYVDRIVDAGERPTPDTPITSLQPTVDDPEPGTPGGVEVPVDPVTGELPTFTPLFAPTNVRITDVVAPTTSEAGRVTVRWNYPSGHPGGADVPAHTGFQVVMRRTVDNEVAQTDRVDTPTGRNLQVGSLVGRTIYIAEVRAVTTLEGAFTGYTAAQLRYILSTSGLTLPSLFSPWVPSDRTRIPPAPVNPVIPPSNVRWDIGTTRHDRVGLRWEYRPPAGAPAATGFRARVCKNSTGTLSCVVASTTDATDRNVIVDRLDDNENYWGWVQTIAGARTSQWIPVGPPRRTFRDVDPQFRNFTIRRIGQTADVQWSVEVSNATQFRVTRTYQPRRTVGGTLVDVGQAEQTRTDWANLEGQPDRQGWFTITPTAGTNRDDSVYRGVANYSVVVEARNPQSQIVRTAVTLPVRALPLFVYQNLIQVGNRGISGLTSAVLSLPAARGVYFAANIGIAAARATANALQAVWHSFRAFGASFFTATGRTIRHGPAIGRSVLSTPSPGRIAATVYQSGGGRALVPTLFSGVRIDVETSYVGWETLEWQVGVRVSPSPTFANHYSATETNDHTLATGSPIIWTRNIPTVDLTNLINVRFYSPFATIRLRTRATNEVGTTPWQNTFLSPNDFTLLTRSTTGVLPPP